jgi:hypothetical protein
MLQPEIAHTIRTDIFKGEKRIGERVCVEGGGVCVVWCGGSGNEIASKRHGQIL